MFIAKFQQVDNSTDKFSADKNGNLPFIGTVLAGTSKGSIINGTMFKRDGLLPNKLYLCENSDFVADNGEVYQNTEVISEVSLLEYPELRTKLGAPKSVTSTVASEEVAASA